MKIKVECRCIDQGRDEDRYHGHNEEEQGVYLVALAVLAIGEEGRKHADPMKRKYNERESEHRKRLARCAVGRTVSTEMRGYRVGKRVPAYHAEDYRQKYNDGRDYRLYNVFLTHFFLL